MTTAEKWAVIQRWLEIDDDGVPGPATAGAVAEALGISFETAATKIPPEAVTIIQEFESCLEPTSDGRFRAYPDPASGWGTPTIGWGTVAYDDGTKVKRGDVITQQRADALLAWEIAEKAAGVMRLVKLPLKRHEFAALISFAYNCGLGNLESSTLLKKLNAGAYHSAADEFLHWNKARDKHGRLIELRGLTRRRRSERNLFLGLPNYIVEL